MYKRQGISSSAKYFMDEDMPIRLSYMGNTFINNHSYQGRLKESTQLGAELIGDDTVDGDAEMIAMAIDVYKRQQEVSPETVLKFREYESEEDEAQDDMTFTRYLLAYYASDLTEKNELKDVYKRLLHFHKEEIEKQEAYLDSIWSDIRCV